MAPNLPSSVFENEFILSKKPSNMFDKMKPSDMNKSVIGGDVKDKKIQNVKDELEYATNWRRVFNKIFTQLKWLNSYADIN